MPGLDSLGLSQVTSMVQGAAMKIIGGVPILKNFGGSTLEKLKLPKHLDIGNIPNILSMVQSGGIGSLLQSPLGAAAGALGNAISSAASAATAALGSGASGFDSALGSLSTSVGSLSGLADNLVGVASTAGLPTNFDLMGHMNLAQSLGPEIPASLSLATATAPVTSSAMLGTIQTQVAAIGAQIAAGTMTPAVGASAVAALQAQIDAVTSGSMSAITSLAAMAPALSAASTAVALLASGPPELQAAMTAAIQPSMLSTVQDLVASHIAAVTNLGAIATTD